MQRFRIRFRVYIYQKMEAAPAEESKDKVSARTRRDLKEKNANPVRPTSDEVKKLDGSLKKTSGFKSKIKANLTAENVESLKKEILGLKLEKYLEEIVTCIIESKFAKPSDIWAAVEVCSLLHQRFSEFADLMVPAVAKLIVGVSANKDVSAEQKDREETSRINKQRTALRLFTEFYLVGLVDACTVLSKKENALLTVLQKTFNINADKEFVNVPIAVVFCKTYENLFTCRQRIESLVPATVRISIKQILSDYYEAASKYLVKMHKYIRKAEVSNYEHAVARGEVSEERQERFQKALKTYEKLLANCQKPEGAAGKLNIGISYSGSKEVDDQEALVGGPWEDEESRSFYEDLIDLKDVVPSILLGEKHEKLAASSSAAELEKLTNEMKISEEISESAEDKGEEDAPIEDLTADLELDDGDEDEKGKDAFNNARQQREAWFEHLPNALSTESIDKLAVEFCYINTKGTRKRLIKTLFAVPRQRLDILPYYSRLIATLNPFIPEIANGLIDLLEKQFHFHQKKTDRTFVEEKVKVVRFIGELTKFRVPPYHVIFHFFKVLLESFSNHNIEAVCNMLETCGRFLYKTPETSRVAGNVLDIMMKKKTALNLDSRLSLLIDNAFYQCNPPEKTAIQQKERPPLELYIRKLFYADLSKKNSERILKQLRMFNWNDPETVALIRKPFFKCWKVKFSNLHVLAFLAFELSRYYSDFGVSVVDQCLEEVRLGLELNLFKYNQRRVSTIRFLGEMYNYRLIESGVVFDTLYILLRFGYENQFPEPGVYSPLDVPHDFFRVRLCCLLLETCGQCFDRGILSQKLDEFLAFLQVYLHSKPRLSMDVEFLMSELFDLLRPKQVLCKSYDEAVDAFNALVTKHVTQDPSVVAQSGVDRFLENSDEEEEEWPTRVGGGGGSGDEGDDDQAADGNAEIEKVPVEEDGEEGEEDVVVHMPEQEVDAELEAEFDKEFSKMMQESLESRKFEKKSQAVFDVAIPVKKGVAFQGAGAGPSADGVVFSFLTKKGNKQQMKAVELPQDSTFVVKTKQTKEAELEEKKQLKKLVLSYDDRADDDETVNQKPLPKGKKGQLLYSNDRQHQHRPNVIPKSLFE
ncbi:armadillo-type protein [Obelidium mucronatum]|nr:armadillo-type protein [Obelidium mucronatum]